MKSQFTIQGIVVSKLDIFSGDKTDYLESQIRIFPPDVLVCGRFLCILRRFGVVSIVRNICPYIFKLFFLIFLNVTC